MAGGKGGVAVRGGRGLLLASCSAAALLIGGGVPSALATVVCKVTQNGGTVATVSNSSATGSCIYVENGADVTGNVINTSAGVLTTNGTSAPSRTGITINNSTVAGSVTFPLASTTQTLDCSSDTSIPA